MKNIFAIEAAKFSFNAFFKNIWFLFYSFVVSAGIFIAGIISSILAGALFFIPIYMILDKIKESFIKLMMADYFAAISANGLTQDVQANLAESAQSWAMWSKVFVDVFYNFPYAVVFSFLGFFVFLTLIFTVLIMLGIGWVKISLNIVDGRENKLSVLFPSLRTIFKVFNFSTLLLLILIAPWVLTAFLFKVNIVAGGIAIFFSLLLTMYLSIKVAYGSWFLIDKNAGVMEAIRFSFGLKYGSRNLLVLFLLLIPAVIVVRILQNISLALLSFVFLKYIVVLVYTILQYVYSIMVIISMAYLYRMLSMRSEQNKL